MWQWIFFKLANIWQSYKQQRSCPLHFLRLLAVLWPGTQNACNFAKDSSILFFFTGILSNTPLLIWLLTTPPHLKYVATRGALKTQVLENAITEKASTKQRISQGWKTHVRKTQVQICRDGKRKYGKCKYNANLQSDKKGLVLHKLVWWIFKWGGQVDYRLFFSEIPVT